MPAIKTTMIEIDSHSTCLVLGSLKRDLKQAEADIKLLMLTRERDLTEDERGELPSTLQTLTREQLREQIDPWISMKMQYEGLIEQFDPDNW